MIPDDETIMAYADGQLDPIAAERVERAMASDATLAARVVQERALRNRLAKAFAPVAAEPLPVALTDRLRTNVVRLPMRAAGRWQWREAAAIAATLVLGVALGRALSSTPIEVAGGHLAAGGALRTALDGDLSGGAGTARMIASFRVTDGRYCRLFQAGAIDGIACRDGKDWSILRTQSARRSATTAYAQAASPAAEMIAAAQNMMAGQPLDAQAERAARDRHWR